jgi:hypothetical protein
MTMTLQEYLNQKNPIKFPNVILDKTEIHKGHTMNVGNRKLTQIWIIDGNAQILWGIMYLLIDNDPTLWTSDNDGNPKNRSCFSLN